MIIIYDDLKVAVNVAAENWSLIECVDKEVEDVHASDGSGKSTAYQIVFCFVTGLTKEISYPTKVLRDKQYEDILNSVNATARSKLAEVRLHPAQRSGAPLIHTR